MAKMETKTRKSKKKVNIFNGRTNEWDTKSWQGRSKYQVETNYKIMGFTFMVVLAGLVLYGLFSLTTYVLG